MSMNVSLSFEHPTGARHHVNLWQTPTKVTYRLLGHDMTKQDYWDHPPVVPPTYEEVRDRYFEWAREKRSDAFQDHQAVINGEHAIWVAAGFTPIWYAI